VLPDGKARHRRASNGPLGQSPSEYGGRRICLGAIPADAENADLNRERSELQADDVGEHRELAAIYVGRGLRPALAREVA
jgi:hypothetical protein